MSAPAAASRPRILVVDDDDATRMLLVRFLGLEGFSVEEAADGHQALEAAGRSRPDWSCSTSRCRRWTGSTC